MKVISMKFYIMVLFLGQMASGCYLPMTGTVIDAETKTPIEGAVVLVEWTKTKGLGFTYTESYNVAESTSDKNGKFQIPGCLCIGTEEPDITIYKKGYVAWNNNYVFPGYRKKTDYQWGANVLLERFKDSYSHSDHVMFMRSRMRSSLNMEAKKVFFNSFDEERLSVDRYGK